ncbi:MAG: biotin/lipoyl-binding protein [Planctomycetota bacterium]
MSLTTDRLGLTAMQTVRPPRALRVLAFVLGALFVGVPPSLFVIPWRQNVPASGKVSALDPLDRVQVIRAPVTGRLTQLNVQEGQPVQKGEILAVMADLDTQRRERLEEQLGFAREKVQLEEQLIQVLENQGVFAGDARDRAIEAAES